LPKKYYHNPSYVFNPSLLNGAQNLQLHNRSALGQILQLKQSLYLTSGAKNSLVRRGNSFQCPLLQKKRKRKNTFYVETYKASPSLASGFSSHFTLQEIARFFVVR